MKSNPMRDSFQRKLAEKQARQRADAAKGLSTARAIRGARELPETVSDVLDSNPVIPAPTAQQIELRLYADMQRLKTIQSVQLKRELKTELLPNYIPWIEGTLAISPAPQSDTLVHLMVWAIDARNYALAVQIAAHCLLNDMVMPEPFTRDLATVFAEQLAEDLIEDPAVAASNADIIEQAVEILKSKDIVDVVRAKLYKAYGLALMTTRPKDAITAFEMALRLNKGIGVKKTIEELTRAIKRGDTESAPDTQSGSQDNTDFSGPGTEPASTALPNSTAQVAERLDAALGGNDPAPAPAPEASG